MLHVHNKMAMVTIVLMAFGLPAQATLLTLSTHSSESDPGPELLNATLDFSVIGSVLTLTVDNLTDENSGVNNAFDIREINFNAVTNATGLNLTGLSGPGSPDINQWSLAFNRNAIIVDGFGYYDIALTDGQGSDENVIAPGETFVFTFDILGTSPYSAADFIQPSEAVGEHIITYAAAKFYDGGDRSAIGAVIPEPATLMLFGICLLSLLRGRKKS